MLWAYGVQTCIQRTTTYLPVTMRSLDAAGFPSPRLFVDGLRDGTALALDTRCEVTVRYPVSHTYPNWLLGILELWLRHPEADRFIMFQDDIIVVRNLRQYLETCAYPEEPAYLNLYTAYGNERIIEGKTRGWHPSNQCGRGALALVFARESLIRLLTANHMMRRPACQNRLSDGSLAYWKNLDGGIIESFKLMEPKSGKEWIHSPSLVQHIGLESSIGNGVYFSREMGRGTTHKDFLAKSFPGREFDATTWIGG